MSLLGEMRCAQLTAADVDHVPLNQALCWKRGLGGEQDTLCPAHIEVKVSLHISQGKGKEGQLDGERF